MRSNITAPLLALCAGLALLTAGCSSLVTAYLVNNLLNDKAPKFVWRGTVTDNDNRGISSLNVTVHAFTQDDPEGLEFTGVTDDTGHYQVTFKWNDSVSYRLLVEKDGATLASRNVGSISKGDQRDDFVVQGTASLAVSGVVRDSSGDPLSGVLVIGASAATATGDPQAYNSSPGVVRFDTTNESGIYEIESASQRFVTVVAYHPDHGFAYAKGEDDDANGELGLNIRMGEAGEHDVQVRVVDGLGLPVASQVLAPNRQFRLRLSVPHNLGSVVDDVVADTDSLFPGFTGVPSDTHPGTRTLTVQSTGLNGIADMGLAVAGAGYDLSLLEIDSNDPATAVVLSENPLALAGDSIVEVRVN